MNGRALLAGLAVGAVGAYALHRYTVRRAAAVEPAPEPATAPADGAPDGAMVAWAILAAALASSVDGTAGLAGAVAAPAVVAVDASAVEPAAAPVGRPRAPWRAVRSAVVVTVLRGLLAALSALLAVPTGRAPAVRYVVSLPPLTPWWTYLRPRVARSLQVMRRCVPVRGPDRAAFCRPFPGVGAFLV